ncbi:MAG: nucleoside triphosphate pyrophosphohydrolase [Firmicutes bacterium]|nr:nucleoside triphosphate pyrophosphohydrolase [Bacillota bacterium]
MAVYEKLVRDRIPDIIQAKGKDCRFSRVSGEQLMSGLEAKLSEEIQEFIDSGRDLEELADILEVVDGLASHLGSSFEEIMKLKQKKRNERGGFQEGIWLEWVQD